MACPGDVGGGGGLLHSDLHQRTDDVRLSLQNVPQSVSRHDKVCLPHGGERSSWWEADVKEKLQAGQIGRASLLWVAGQKDYIWL